MTDKIQWFVVLVILVLLFPMLLLIYDIREGY